MKSIKPIRYTIAAPLAVLSLAACQQQSAPEPTPPPPPPPVASPSPPPPAPAPSPAYANWRDAPQTEGTWRSVRRGEDNHEAHFLTPAGEKLVEIRCRNRTVEIRRAGTGTQELPMTFRTFQADGSDLVDTVAANPVRPLMYEARIFYPEKVLDRIAFSRGRFALEVPGLPTLYLPTRPEMVRVFQECRM